MIALASDHAAYKLKEELKRHFSEKGVETEDFGTYSEESCDYPVFAKKACKAVLEGSCEFAILICGTGIGMSMCANKIKGIRAAVVSDSFSAHATREHNDANVICLGARTIGPDLAKDLVDIFLNTPFSGEEKHQRRINQLES